jgi:exosome complex component RRP4
MQKQLVLAGDKIPSDKNAKAAKGTARVNGEIVATHTGFARQAGDYYSVIPFNACYEPRAGDTIVGMVKECNPGNWIIDIRAPWDAPMHVSEAPWRVDFGETLKYLKPGDNLLCKVLFVDEQKKVQVTMKDRNLMKLEGGKIIDVAPVKVARIIGKNGSMLNLIKEYVECWLYVGQNGRVWIDGDAEEVLLADDVINLIADEAHLPGLTDKVRAMLEQRKPGGADGEIIEVDVEEVETESSEEE